MEVTFLVRGEDARSELDALSLPDGVSRDSRPCEASGGRLRFVSLATPTSTIRDAIALANLRDSLPESGDRKIIRDDASAKFGEILYPRLSRFERGLRAAMTLAICVNQDNFDSEIIANLEDHSGLGSLESALFDETDFVRRIRAVATALKDKKRVPSKAELMKDLEAASELTLWEDLFGEDDLPALRKNYRWIKGCRDGVMHLHTIRAGWYKSARRTLELVNHELDDYIERMRKAKSFDEESIKRANASVTRANDIFTREMREQLSSLATSMLSSHELQSALEAVQEANMKQLQEITRSISKSLTPAIKLPSTDFGISKITQSLVPRLQPPSLSAAFLEGMKMAEKPKAPDEAFDKPDPNK